MFNTEALLATLPYMAKGMFGIFVVTILIVLSVFVLNKLGNAMDAKNNDSNGQM